MDRDALVARVKTRFQDPDNRTLSDADIVEYLNDAYSDVLSARPDWPFLEARNEALSVTAQAAGVSLPTDVWRVTAVFNATDKLRLQQLDGRAAYRDAFPDAASEFGTPQYYRLRGSYLEVYPRPAATTTLHVDHFVAPATLATGADEPVFPEQYHRMLVAGAMRYAYEDDGNLQAAQAAGVQFDRLLAQMAQDLLGNRTDAYPQVLDTF